MKKLRFLSFLLLNIVFIVLAAEGMDFSIPNNSGTVKFAQPTACLDFLGLLGYIRQEAYESPELAWTYGTTFPYNGLLGKQKVGSYPIGKITHIKQLSDKKVYAEINIDSEGYIVSYNDKTKDKYSIESLSNFDYYSVDGLSFTFDCKYRKGKPTRFYVQFDDNYRLIEVRNSSGNFLKRINYNKIKEFENAIEIEFLTYHDGDDVNYTSRMSYCFIYDYLNRVIGYRTQLIGTLPVNYLYLYDGENTTPSGFIKSGTTLSTYKDKYWGTESIVPENYRLINTLIITTESDSDMVIKKAKREVEDGNFKYAEINVIVYNADNQISRIAMICNATKNMYIKRERSYY